MAEIKRHHQCSYCPSTCQFPRARGRARDGEYWLIGKVPGRMTVVLTQGATAASRVAAVIPFDADFATRTEAMLRLSRMLDGKSRPLPRDRLTKLGRERLLLKLRALDARLSGETYRSIAQVLLAEGRVREGRSWKAHDLRSRIIRLVKEGRVLMRGGYRDLLQMPHRGKGKRRRRSISRL